MIGMAMAAVAMGAAPAPVAAPRKPAIQNSGYSRHGASTRKRSMVGWQTDQGGPDSDIVDNLDKLRERSRDLCMGEGLAIGALKTIRTNEIGAGLRLNAQIDAAYLGLTPEAQQVWEDRVEREWATWADSKSCDAARRCTFGELQALARLSQLMSGDVFALLPSIDRGGRYDLTVKLVEADVVCDPMVKPTDADILGGVEVGSHGEPVAYHFMNRHPGDVLSGHLTSIGIQKWTRVEAFGRVTGRPLVLHLMESERPGQRRGVPILAPVLEKFKQLARYTTAEMDAAVVHALFAAFIKTDRPEQGPVGQVVTDAEKAEVPQATNDVQLAPGMLMGLNPGESVEEVNPTHPNAGFEAFVGAVCKQIGVGIGVPFHVLLKFFDGSYNTSRAALLEFWKTVNEGRARTAMGFCQPVYEAWLEEAILRGYIDAPGFEDPLRRAAWCGAKWIGPTQGQLDPVKEVEAAASRVREGFSTRTDETIAMTGSDWWGNNLLRGREEQARADAGINGAKPALVLTPTDVAAIATVDEGRASVGLPPVEGAEGDRWIIEHTQQVAPDQVPGAAPAQAGA